MPDELISVSLTPEQKRCIRREAGARDLAMSEFGRQVLVDWLEENEAEAATN